MDVNYSYRYVRSLWVTLITFFILGPAGILIAGPVSYIEAPGGISIIFSDDRQGEKPSSGDDAGSSADPFLSETMVSDSPSHPLQPPASSGSGQAGTSPGSSTHAGTLSGSGNSGEIPGQSSADAGSGADFDGTASVSAKATQALKTTSATALAFRTVSDYENTTYDSTAYPVGHVAGDFAVSASGAATYNIPIAVPPGTAGVKPTISLNYDSQSGDGIAGRGFHLSGLSAISRCGRTEAQDGYIRAVHLDEKDAFCLDGQRLIQTGGNTTSGSGIRTYRKEIDDYSTITANFSGYQATQFEIHTLAGDTLIYGNSDETRVDAKTQTGADASAGLVSRPVISWLLSRTQDKLGNYIQYQYTEGLGSEGWQYRLTDIRYTGNESLGLSPYIDISFDYEVR